MHCLKRLEFFAADDQDFRYSSQLVVASLAHQNHLKNIAKFFTNVNPKLF
jgi:hypothetical protein